MNSTTNSATSSTRVSRTLVLAIVFFVMLVIYGWVYQFSPLSPYSDFWNNKVLDILTLIPAVAAAYFGTMLTRQFERTEPPYRIWLAFTIGWWSWVVAELLGFVYDAIYWETGNPELTFMDLFWSLGYIFIGLSLYYQFRLIYNRKSGRNTTLYLLFVGVAFAIAFGMMQWALAAGLAASLPRLAVYMGILYPVFDVFEGGAALWLFFLYGRGYMGRPWWGLIAFAISDGMNAFFWIGGNQRVSNGAYSVLDLFSALAFVAAYMITALAFLSAVGHIHSGISRQSAYVPSTPPTANSPK